MIEANKVFISMFVCYYICINIIIILSALYFHKDSSDDVKTNRSSHFPQFYDDWGHTEVEVAMTVKWAGEPAEHLKQTKYNYLTVLSFPVTVLSNIDRF